MFSCQEQLYSEKPKIQKGDTLMQQDIAPEVQKAIWAFDNYWVNPMLQYIPYADIMELDKLSDSNIDPTEKNNSIDKIMFKYGFFFIGAGSNRRVYGSNADNRIVIKVAVNRNGRAATLKEQITQNVVKPFCYKVFESTPRGGVGLIERLSPFYDIHQLYEYRDSLCNLYIKKILRENLVAQDIGTIACRNFGFRDESSPMVKMGGLSGVCLIDFPYIYLLDPKKATCKAKLDNGTTCCGNITYDDEFNYLHCTKCGRSYLPRELADHNSYLGNLLFKIDDMMEGKSHKEVLPNQLIDDIGNTQNKRNEEKKMKIVVRTKSGKVISEAESRKGGITTYASQVEVKPLKKIERTTPVAPERDNNNNRDRYEKPDWERRQYDNYEAKKSECEVVKAAIQELTDKISILISANLKHNAAIRDILTSLKTDIKNAMETSNIESAIGDSLIKAADNISDVVHGDGEIALETPTISMTTKQDATTTEEEEVKEEPEMVETETTQQTDDNCVVTNELCDAFITMLDHDYDQIDSGYSYKPKEVTDDSRCAEKLKAILKLDSLNGVDIKSKLDEKCKSDIEFTTLLNAVGYAVPGLIPVMHEDRPYTVPKVQFDKLAFFINWYTDGYINGALSDDIANGNIVDESFIFSAYERADDEAFLLYDVDEAHKYAYVLDIKESRIVDISVIDALSMFGRPIQ